MCKFFYILWCIHAISLILIGFIINKHAYIKNMIHLLFHDFKIILKYDLIDILEIFHRLHYYYYVYF